MRSRSHTSTLSRRAADFPGLGLIGDEEYYRGSMFCCLTSWRFTRFLDKTTEGFFWPSSLDDSFLFGLKNTSAASVSVLVWRCDRAHGMGHLHICEDLINTEQYVHILEQHISCNLHQDHAKPHSARITSAWLRTQRVLDWPAVRICVRCTLEERENSVC